MRTPTRPLHILLVSVAASLACAAMGGCAPDDAAPPTAPAPAATPDTANTTPATHDTTLALLADTSTGDDRYDAVLSYRRAEGQDGPRAVEAFVRFGAGLRYVGSAPLEATERAGKRLVVQEHGEGELRVILFASDNLAALDSGPLARLRFEPADQGDVEVAFVASRVSLAPAAAARGLTVSAPLTLGGHGP